MISEKPCAGPDVFSWGFSASDKDRFFADFSKKQENCQKISYIDQKTIYGRPFKDGLYKIEEKKVVDSVDIKTAVIYRLNDLIKQKDITVNEAAVRSGVPPSTLKNILYGQSRNAGVVTIKKICDGLDITIQEFFEDPIFADLEPEL